MAEDAPSVSVVIPVRNEASNIAAAIGSALGQDYRGNLEVVVADGMSDDGTREVLEALAFAHERPEPVVHRDIKPGNVMLEHCGTERERAKVLDFGIA